MKKLVLTFFVLFVAASFLFKSGNCNLPITTSDRELKLQREHGLVTEYSCYESRGYPFPYYTEAHGWAPVGVKWIPITIIANVIIYGTISFLIGFLVEKVKKRKKI